MHLLKNIRNNWLNQKNAGRCLYFPSFEDQSQSFSTASFSALKKLYEIESTSLVTYFRLSFKCLTPTNLERQNVKLVLKIFNKFVPEALEIMGQKFTIPNYNDTATFIQLINKWWKIINVKHPLKGSHQKDDFMSPLTANQEDKKLKFLHMFVNWLDSWKEMKCTTGSFSKETHNALAQTTYGIIQLTEYCVTELHFEYILPGKLQTDNLEARFGRYRQLAGAQYNISMRQVLECEKKLRLQSIAALDIPTKNGILDFEEQSIPDQVHIFKNAIEKYPVVIIDADLNAAFKYLKILTYLGGYCCHSVLKNLKCEECKHTLTISSEITLPSESYTLVKNLDKGGLLCPRPFVVDFVFYNYIITSKLRNNQEFLNCKNPRQVLILLTRNILEEHEIINEEFSCANGHCNEIIMDKILWVSSNILLKNLCLNKNDIIVKENNKKKSRSKGKI